VIDCTLAAMYLVVIFFIELIIFSILFPLIFQAADTTDAAAGDSNNAHVSDSASVPGGLAFALGLFRTRRFALVINLVYKVGPRLEVDHDTLAGIDDKFK
jgi:hypothetical protein